MSKNCYNLLSFWGNARVDAQVSRWKSRLEEAANSGALLSDTDHILAIFFGSEFNLSSSTEILLEYEDEIISAGPKEIGLVSQAQRPELLEKLLACYLYRFDKRVVVRNYYHIIEHGMCGVSYTSPYNSLDAYNQYTTIASDYESFTLPEEAETYAEKELQVAEIQIIEYFLDDMPQTKSTFKKNVASKQIDWESI